MLNHWGLTWKGLTHSPYRSSTCLIYILFSEKNTIFLRESCQIVQPLAPDQIPVEAKENNYGLSNPGSIQAYLQVVDLMADKLRYASISLNCLCSSWIIEILNSKYEWLNTKYQRRVFLLFLFKKKSDRLSSYLFEKKH